MKFGSSEVHWYCAKW